VDKNLKMPVVKKQAQKQIADGRLVLGLPKRLKELYDNEAWVDDRKANGHRFKDFTDYCRTNQPYGLGLGQYNSYATAEMVYTLCRHNKDMQTALRPLVGKEVRKIAENGEIGRGRNSLDNIKPNQGGTSREYLLGRLKRDSPEIFKAWCNGEKFSGSNSVRQAAIAAGIIKVDSDKNRCPIKRIKMYWKRANKTQRAELLKWLKSAEGKLV